MVYPRDWKKVTCRDWYEDENKMWLCLRNKNAICEIDKKSKVVKILGSFPHNGLGEVDLSLSVGKYRDYIVFCPFRANDIAIFKTSTSELKFIALSQFIDKKIYIDTKIEKFYRMICYKSCVFFFGIKYPAIMRLDLNTGKIDFFDEWLGEIERCKCKEIVLFTDGYARRKNMLYLPMGRRNEILKINLDTMEWDYIKLGLDVSGFLGMTQSGNSVWLTEYNKRAKKFFQWNLDDGKIIQIGLPCQEAFYAPLYYKESLLFSLKSGKSYRYELESGKWENTTDTMLWTADSGDRKVSGEEIAYFSRNGRFYHWNPQTGAVRFDEFKIEDRDFLKSSWEDYCGQYKGKEVKEGKQTLEDYLESIVLFPTSVSKSFRKRTQNGKQIWELLKMEEKKEGLKGD